MLLKTIAVAGLMAFASTSLQAADSEQTKKVIVVKEIGSASVDKSYRQLKVSANTTRYVVTFEKPCYALRRSDVSVDNQTTEQLSAGTELKVGTSSCVIKSIQRDLDLPTIGAANRLEVARQETIIPRN